MLAEDGTVRRRLTRNKVDDWSPAWSPDGHAIAFIRAQGGYAGSQYDDGAVASGRLYRMRADGTNVRRVARVAVTAVAWGAGGTAFAATSLHADRLRVLRIDAASGRVRTIWTGAGPSCSDPFGIAWSPDGRTIAVRDAIDGNRTCRRVIRLIPANGRGRSTIVTGGTR